MKRVVPLLALAGSLRADVVLPPIFSDHAVLQKFEIVPVWGKAQPGEKIAVKLDRATASTSEEGVEPNATGDLVYFPSGRPKVADSLFPSFSSVKFFFRYQAKKLTSPR